MLDLAYELNTKYQGKLKRLCKKCQPVIDSDILPFPLHGQNKTKFEYTVLKLAPTAGIQNIANCFAANIWPQFSK